MKRLTEVDEKGNWHIAGVEWGKCKGNLYGALCKLKDYEDTGLTPAEIMDGKMFSSWIPVSERLPIGKKFEIKIDGEVYHRHVLVQCADEDIPICIAYYDTNAWFCACTNQELNVLAWMPLQEEYKAD